MNSTTSNTLDKLGALDQRLEHWSERLNPILVKEMRQLWNSRLFLGTFLVLLTAAWACCVGALLVPEIVLEIVPLGYSPYGQINGAALFFLLYCCLVVALFIIVPVCALESLAAEFDENTMEMLILTPMPADRITQGKMWCATLHMGLYFAALAPLMSVTYLLSGISVPSIVLLLLFAFIGAAGLTCLALLLGSYCKKPMARPVAIIVLMSVCVLCTMGWLGTVFGLLQFHGGVFFTEQWYGMACCFIPWLVVSSVCFGLAVRRVRPRSPLLNRLEFLHISRLIDIAQTILHFADMIRTHFPVEFDEPPAKPPPALPFREAHNQILMAAKTADRLMNRDRRPFEFVSKQTPLTPRITRAEFSRLRRLFYEVIEFYYWTSICDNLTHVTHWPGRFQMPTIRAERLAELEAAARDLITACQQEGHDTPLHHRPADTLGQSDTIWEE